MKIRINFIIIIFISIYGYSQSPVKDSITNVLNSIKNDSLKHLEFGKLIKLYRKSNPDLHFFVVNQHLEKAKKNNDAQTQGKLYRELGVYQRQKGNLNKALKQYKKAIAIFSKNSDSLNLAKTRGNLANIYKAQGNYEAAIKNIKESLTFFEIKQDKFPQGVVINKVNLAGIYITLKDWVNADKFLIDAYNNPFTKKTPSALSSVAINLVTTKTELGKLEEALKFAKQAEGIEKRPNSLANLYNNIGVIYDKKVNYQYANTYYKKSLELYEKIGNKNGIERSYNNLGDNATKLADYAAAEVYLLKANSLLLASDNLKSLSYNYDMLSSLYMQKKEYKSALEYSDLQKKIQDSLFSLEKQKAIADFEVLYETEKKEREKNIATQQLQITKLESVKNRNLFIGALIIAGLVLLTLLFYYSRFKAKKKAELVTVELKETQKRLAIEKQYKDSELKALKAQMNPHFIFNALNSIQDYIVLNQKNLASDYLGKFADLIRNYLHFSDTGYISVPDEVHNLKLYLELEKLRFEDALDYNFSINDNANSELIKIPTMLIQPYVENALKHGLLHKKDNRALQISITKISPSIIECIVEDNGIGRAKSKEINQKRAKQHQSFALKATTERLDLLNFGKAQKIGVDVIDLMHEGVAIGTKVILKIPILKL